MNSSVEFLNLTQIIKETLTISEFNMSLSELVLHHYIMKATVVISLLKLSCTELLNPKHCFLLYYQILVVWNFSYLGSRCFFTVRDKLSASIAIDI